MKRTLTALALAALLLGGCGGDDDSDTTSTAANGRVSREARDISGTKIRDGSLALVPGPGECVAAGRAKAVLEAGLRYKATLLSARTAAAKDEGVYFVSARLAGPGFRGETATWAVDGGVLTGNGGKVQSVDDGAEQFSIFERGTAEGASAALRCVSHPSEVTGAPKPKPNPAPPAPPAP